MSSRYAMNAGAVYSLKYHIVWCVKYRRPVLTTPVAARLTTLVHEKATALDLTIHTLDVMPDHVHVFVESGPTICVAEIVNGLKGVTSHVLRAEFHFLKSRLPTLWSRSYYAGAVGSVSEAVMRRYIEAQKGK